MGKEKLYTTKQAAEYLGLSAQTLANWRHQRVKGPKYKKLGQRAIRYTESALDEFVNACTINPNA